MTTGTAIALGSLALVVAGGGIALYLHHQRAQAATAAATAAARAAPAPRPISQPSTSQEVAGWAQLAGGLLGQASNLGLF